MAKFTYFSTFDFDSYKCFIGVMMTSVPVTATQFSYRSLGFDTVITAIGTGFTYDGTIPKAGKISKFEVRDTAGNLLLEITGANMKVATLMANVLGGLTGPISTDAGAEAFQTLLRAGKDTVLHQIDFGRSISTYGGDDVVRDGAGNSDIHGGLGNDTLYGGGGDDLLEGGNGADVLYGGAGDDWATWAPLISGVKVNGADDATLGVFQVLVTTGTGIDKVYDVENFELTNFNDTVNIQASTANRGLYIEGMGGNDTMTTAGAYDTLAGGAGNDVLNGGDAGDGGEGVDRVTSAHLSFWSADTGGHGVVVNLSLTSNRVTDDGFGNVENGTATLGVYGSKWDDRITGRLFFADDLYGNDGNDSLYGLGGNDTIYGGNGDDLVSGGDGNDLLGGGPGSDTIDGGAGIDELDLWHAGATAGVTVYLRGTSDGMVIGWMDGSDVLRGIENVSGTEVDDGINGDDFANVLWGNEGNDRIYGSFGNDELYGGAGNDSLSGDPGDDTLMGGTGRDTMDGGYGNDLLAFWNEDDGSKHAVSVNLAAAVQVLNDGYRNAETATNFEMVAGTIWNDTIWGGTGNDVLWGNEGADTLRGYLGNDFLYGGDGNDLLSGGVGVDELWGYAGDDTLEGLDGTDYFMFTGDGVDTVLDFNRSFDWLEIWQFGGLAVNSGLTAAQFASGAGVRVATTAAQRVIYDTTSGDLLYDVDGMGGADAVVFARLTNHASVLYSDFWVWG